MYIYKTIIKFLFSVSCVIAVTSVIAEKQVDQAMWQKIAERNKGQIGQTYWYYPERCVADKLMAGIEVTSPTISMKEPFELTIVGIVPDKNLIPYLQVKLTNSQVGYKMIFGALRYETDALKENKNVYRILECLSKNSPDVIANAPAAAAKTESLRLEVERQIADNVNQRLKSQDAHSYQLPTSDVKVFDAIVMGLSTMKDIDKIASKPQFSASSCSIDNKCEYINIKTSQFGELGDSFYSTEMGNIPLSFADFELQGQHFSASFFEGLIVELRVKGSSYWDWLDESLVKELRPSFDQKYKKLKLTSQREKSDDRTYTYTFESWVDRSGAFDVRLKTTRKVLNIPEHTCLNALSVLKAAGIGTAEAEWGCKKVTDNVPVYRLAYRHPEGFAKAIADLNKLQAERTANQKKESLKKISNF